VERSADDIGEARLCFIRELAVAMARQDHFRELERTSAPDAEEP
jgi:hypothetical protein